LHVDEPAGAQLVQVGGGGRGGQAGLGGEPGGRQGAPVGEGEQDPGACWVGDQRGRGGQVSVPATG